MVFLRAGILFFAAIALTSFRVAAAGDPGSRVQVIGSKGNWQLVVNGKPFYLKGVGVPRIEGRYEKADYLKLAKGMGANAVRTWGIEEGNREYLDRAHQYGLYVSAGIWLNPVYPDGKGSYVHDEAYKQTLKDEILDYVQKNKSHPAILFWNVGNETIFWTKSEGERVAFAQFLEEIIQEIHRIDANHPVVYTSAATTALPYIKKYAPSVDIFGVNAYGGFEKIHQEMSGQLNIPYLVTEFGTIGNWDKSNDLNGVAVESTDDMKAHYYKVYAHQIRNFSGHCLGGFAFQLGDTTQTSSSWWNINYGQHPKAAYFVMKTFYHDNEHEYKAPVIKDMLFSKRKGLHPGERFDVEVRLRPFDGQLRYKYFATTARDINFFEEYPNHKVPIRVKGKGKKVAVYAPLKAGVYRIYAVVIDDAGAASVFNKSISVIAQE